MPDPSPRILNINVGVLGHVDSGKTSLVAALSTRLSTAALDKHPQSKERGITLDLGFSSFTVPLPERLQELPYDELQFTLVDCPGHASLIRTIIGGAQIIDMMMLVVDITKGIQTQTAECLVVGEIATQDLVVVLNKVDLLPEHNRAKLVARAKKRLAQTFNATKFAGTTMVPVSAKPGGGEGEGPGAQGVEALVAELVARVPARPRRVDGSFLFSIDHCFGIRGQGTVLTGTVLQGEAKVGQTIELPELKAAKKIRSMQMFRQPVQQCQQGDRVGICVTQLDAKLIERGIACAPGTVPTFDTAIVAVEKIRFFAARVPSKQKLHVTAGHATVMATAQFLGVPAREGVPAAEVLATMTKRIGQLALKDTALDFDFSREYVYQDELHGLEGRPPDPLEAASSSAGAAASGAGEPAGVHYGPQWALLRFSQHVTAPKDALVIGSRLDGEDDGSSCRLAFYGRIAALVDAADSAALPRLRIYKLKQKVGAIDRVERDGRTAVCRGMFKKETDLSLFVGMKVVTAAGEVGTIESTFGKSGKFKVAFPGGVASPAPGSNRLTLTFKKYIFDKDKRHMAQ